MKFVYQYRTPDNRLHRATVRAASKEAAYALLKARGVNPGRVEEAPGFFNKLFGKGKRWLAIAVLALVAAALAVVLLENRRVASEQDLYEDRSQIYGDPFVLSECEAAGWTNVFASAFDCHLARYAVPGKRAEAVFAVGRLPVPSLEPSPVSPSDLAEIAQMKRMVNGIKRELSEYVAAGGTVEKYLWRLNIRQQAEVGILTRTRQELLRTDDPAVWRRRNSELRAMGLPMVEMPDDERAKGK